MQRGRSFVILLVIALGIGAYIYFVESKRDPLETEAKTKVFAGLEPGTVEEIEIKAESGEVTRIRKQDGDWQIVQPAGVPADSTKTSSIASTLESLEEQRVVSENASSLASFGLEPPRITVAFRKAGETDMRRLLVGRKTPTGSDLYAKVDGQPKVFLIASFLEDSLNQTTFDLREKSALKFARDGVDALRLEAPGSPATAFAKKGDAWRLTAPASASADFAAVDGIVSRLFQAQMKSLVAEDVGSDAAKYGFDKPQATATLGLGSTQATLVIGAKQDDTSVYARDLSRPIVFTVESALLDELKKKPEDVRRKDVFAFRSFNATALELIYAGRKFAFAKQKPAADPNATAAEVWKMTSPEAKDVDQAALTTLMSALSNLRAESFADKPVTGGEDLVVVAQHGDAAAPSEDRATIRKSGDKAQAIVTGEPGAFVLPTADVDNILKQVKDLVGIK
jgi:hypothetical protein